jgi:hypothetical protein
MSWGQGKKVTGARAAARKVGGLKGTIRAPRHSGGAHGGAKQGAGLGGGRLRKGTIRSQNNYGA